MREWKAVLSAARFLSLTIAVLTLLVGALYAGPEQLVRRPLPPGQETIVAVIEYLFPVWPFLFAFAGAVLCCAAYCRRGLAVTHGLVVAAWGFYGLCLILAPIRSVPPSPILVGVIAMGIAAINFTAARLWSALGVK
ncbi:hypothetical protein [Rhodococcus sp. I2R]|uniref:hypothetical protein n=1 Tax=Rhodococcus sp. I2R TaxID=2855445 RepID=UPI001E59D4DB|nr:hypothetical protein [Rhodococcus sp. I2R]MCC8930833.1 hypothetical protein [Rhodococcus sp. I2R]